MLKLRKSSLVLHRYIGILAGLVVCIVGITGSLLVFEAEIDRSLQPYQIVSQAERLPHERLITAAQQVHPALKPHRITVPESIDRPYIVMMADAEDNYTDVMLNPYTGKVLDTKPWKQTFGGWLIDLHVHLFAGNLGEQIVGISGIALLLLGITGLFLWTGWRKLKPGFKIRWQARWQILNYDLHNVGGIISVLLLSLVAFTGAAMVYYTPVEAGLRWLLPSAPAPEVASQVVAGKIPMSADAILNIAQTRFPTGQLFKFYPAKTPESTFRVWLHLEGKSDFTKDVNLDFDRYTGTILKIKDARTAGLVDRILSAQYTLHVGHYGGIVTKIIYGVIGVAPIGLFATGATIWWSRTYAAKPNRRLKIDQ
jgi:uncharacterized iron-regulated membrane protein